MSLRADAMQIFRAALKAADPAEAIHRFVQRRDNTLTVGAKRYKLDRFRNIYVLGAGKASAAMSRALEDVLGRRMTGGLVTTKYGHGLRLQTVEIHECGHPVPDEAGVEGAMRLAKLAQDAGENDLVLVVISGGASSLTPFPAPPITLAEKQETTRMLLESGASIHEINTVRKHISAIKGGQLARLAAPATVITLILSDVIGDPVDVIGSGPTVADPSTFADASKILARYDLLPKVPRSVFQRLDQGLTSRIPETPKSDDPAFARAQHLIVGSNRLAVDAAVAKAKALGYKPMVLSTLMEGEAREVARMHASILREARLSGCPVKAPACLVSGGETTVTIRGDGKGGRNQEFALAAAIDLAGTPDVLLLSAGTDGTDGPTDAAGAMADGTTIERAQAKGLAAEDFLRRNDSYRFFESVGDLIRIGPTRTNVMDVCLMLLR